LIKMPMDSVTSENVEQILKEKTDTETELNVLRTTTLENMWLHELSLLDKEYTKYKTKRESLLIINKNVKSKPVKKQKIVKK